MVSKKKGHAKSGKRKSSKVSLTKLSNKKLNKLSKQGKLKRKLPKSKLLQLIKDRTNPDKEKELRAEDEPVQKEEPDIPLVEADYEYFATPGRDFSFLSDIAEDHEEEHGRRGKRRKKIAEEEEAPYEKQSRTILGPTKEVKALLPTKSKEKGIMPQSMEVEEEAGDEDEEAEEMEEAPTDEAEKKALPALSVAQLLLQRQQKLDTKKRKIALLSSSVMENPEEQTKKLRELRQMLEESDPDLCVTVRKLVMVSLMEVFKDIIPGYRIRVATEKERQQSAKKETKILRLFEENLLSNFRHYLEFLEEMSKAGKGSSKNRKHRKKVNGMTDIPREAAKSLQLIAIQCLCEMLVTHPHFNFRTNIIAVVVPFMGNNNPKISGQVCDAIQTIFKQDKAGDVTLEITRLIGRLIKAKHFDVHPKVLNTFLSLKITEIEKPGEGSNKKNSQKKKSEDMSRKERKRKKQMVELERELEDAAFFENKKKRIKLHTQVINMVFLTYFRILKQARYSRLLSAVLEGLAKFAHLINVDFFDDLFSVLKDLVDSADLTYRESLHCVKTAFVILSGQGSALNIDPLRFYRHLYTQLLQLHAGHSSEDVPVAIECMDLMISKRRRQVSHQRFLAFAKRSTMLSLQLHSHGALGMLATTRHLLHAYPKADVLLDTESEGSGLYMPELEEPEHCNAHNTALYELHTLRHHFHPTVRQYASHLLHGAPSQGVGQLPTELARKSPVALFEDYNPGDVTFNPPIEKQPPATKKKARSYPDVLQKEIQDSTKQALMAVQEIKLSTLNFLCASSATQKAAQRQSSKKTLQSRSKAKNLNLNNTADKSKKATGRSKTHSMKRERVKKATTGSK